jgi:hypothetical protein
VAGIEFQNGFKDFQQRVGAANNRSATVKNEPPAGLEPVKALLGDPHRECNAELASAMAIKAAVVVNEIGRVRHDDVCETFNSPKDIAEHGLRRSHIVYHRVDRAERERLAVDIAKQDLGALAE